MVCTEILHYLPSSFLSLPPAAVVDSSVQTSGEAVQLSGEAVQTSGEADQTSGEVVYPSGTAVHQCLGSYMCHHLPSPCCLAADWEGEWGVRLQLAVVEPCLKDFRLR